MADTIRTHVVLPANLVAEIDELVGPRQRSNWIANLIENHFRNARLRDALDALKASPPPDDLPPEWEDSARWVHEQRYPQEAVERRAAS